MKLPLHQAEVVASKEKKQLRPCATACSGGDCRHPERCHGDGSESGESGIDAFPERHLARHLDVKDPVTGKPPSMRYQIQNNKGFARVVHGDNVVCRAEVFSGLHSNGELMIKSRGTARCTDGSRYPMPESPVKQAPAISQNVAPVMMPIPSFH
jgi:hypothetical protein